MHVRLVRTSLFVSLAVAAGGGCRSSKVGATEPISPSSSTDVRAAAPDEVEMMSVPAPQQPAADKPRPLGPDVPVAAPALGVDGLDRRSVWIGLSETGVHAIDETGQLIETLSPVGAIAGHVTPDGAILVLGDDHRLRALSHVAEVAHVDHGLVERTLAELPTAIDYASCQFVRPQPVDYERHEPLALQAATDMWISRDDALLCVELMDRNVNMATTVVDIAYRLADGAWVAAPVEEFEACDASPKQTVGVEDAAAGAMLVACAKGPRPELGPTRRGEHSHIYDDSQGNCRLAARDGTSSVTLETPDIFDVERFECLQYMNSASPSGRMQVMWSREDAGDYVYNRGYLLDLEKGSVLPLRAGPWPEPLSPARLRAPVDEESPTTTFTGEAQFSWLREDLLFAGGLLVRVGQEMRPTGMHAAVIPHRP